MAVATLTLAMASVIHFGNTVALGIATIHDPFSGAALPEAIIAGVIAAGVLSVVARRTAPTWWVALTTSLFALAGVILGLVIFLRGSVPRPGDVVDHLSILVELLVTVGLILMPATRQAFGRLRD